MIFLYYAVIIIADQIRNARLHSNLMVSKETRENAKSDLNASMELYFKKSDLYRAIHVCNSLKAVYVKEGNWKELLELEKQKENELLRYDSSPLFPLLRARNKAGWKVSWIWMGRYSETESLLRKTWGVEINFGCEQRDKPPRDLLLAIGMQHRYSEVIHDFDNAVKQNRESGGSFAGNLSYYLGFWGIVALKCGFIPEAEIHFKEAFDSSQGFLMKSEWSYYLGMCHLAQGSWEIAEQHFSNCLNWRKIVGYNYFECGALVGRLRVKYAQKNYIVIPPLLVEAEKLAQQYEYNDHLASMRLTQAHITWDGNIPEWGKGFDDALHYYQQVLIYALRYNRFLLDEVLSGRSHDTFKAIIPYCMEHDEEGLRMLIALRDWWSIGSNDIGQAKPYTISPIPEDIKLIKAEQIAREREPGESSPQRTVLEQINAALPGI